MRKTVTVLFCDLVGSTAFGEQVDAESARDVLGRYHAMAQRVVDDHGGTVAKFIGDGVMAIFGVPEVAVDDADRAVAAGLDLQRGFASIGSLTSRRYRTELGLRVGINTGEVVIADEDADVVGDVLNTAARLEAACAPGQVLVGEDTWRLTRSTITYETLGEIEAKGKREGVATFRAVDGAERIDESTTPFVGRDDELSRLHVVFDAAVTACEARLATVIGAPGVGKTRLAAEFERALGDTATLVDLRVERAGGTTFAPVADLLRAVAGVEMLVDEDGPADGEVLVGRLRSVVAGLDDADRVAPLLAGFLGFGHTRSTEELFFAVRRLLEALGRERTIVLVVDDIQWAEPLFLDLLENLVEWIRGSPVMIVALARPEIRELRPAFAEVGRRVADSISLEGLDAGATADLAARLVGADSLPRDLLARLPESTEGNPLFVRELMRMLVDDRVIVETDRGWELRIDADAVDVPPTIQSLLSTRIERLPDDERRVVELASVVGPEFPLGAVAAIEGSGAPGALLPVLERLRRKELVDPTGTYWGDEPVFRFHHVLIRDSAYRRLLKDSRADLHLQVASWMEEAAAGVGGEQEVVVGYHLEQAHELRRQLNATGDETVDIGRRSAALLGAAARRALARDDVAAAGSLFVRAVARLEPTAEELPDLLMLGCDALLAVGDVAEAAPLLKQLDEHATGDERLSGWASSFRAQLLVLTDPDRLEDAEQRSAAAAQRLADLGDSAGEASARLVRAGALARLGHIGDCEAELDLALAAARAATDGRRVATVLGAAPVAAVWGPSSVSRAGGRCLDVIRLLRITTGSPSVEATATRCQAVLEALRGRFDTARTMLAESRQAVEELGHRRGLLETQLYSGIVELMADDPVAAEPHLRDAYAGLGRLGIGADAGQAAAHLSRALLQQGRLDEAADLAVDSESLAGQNPQTAIAAKTARAEILAAQGDLDSALRLAEDAVARAEGTDIVIDHANANLALARVREAAGDERGARSAFAAAERLLREKGASLDVGASAEVQGAAPTPAPSVEQRTERAADDGSGEGPWNRADAVARELLSAFASGDTDTLDRLLAPDISLSIRSLMQESYTTKAEVIAALSVDSFDHRSTPEFETLAVRGDDLVLARMEQRPDDDAAGLDIRWLAVVRTAADDRADLGVMFDLDDVDAAIEELDRLYLEREDDIRTRYLTRLLTWSFGLIAHSASDGSPAFAPMLDAVYLHNDHRPLGWGRLDHDEYVDRLRTLLSFDGKVSLVLRRILAAEGPLTWAEVRLQVTQSAEAPRIDDQWNIVESGPNGVSIRTDQYGTDQVDDARTCFDEASAACRASGRLWNVAATGGAAAVNTWAAAGRWNLVADWLADDFQVLDEHGDPVERAIAPAEGADPAWAMLGVDQRDVLAIRGERLALTDRCHGAGDEREHQLAVEEVDRDGRLARVTLFPADDLADALRHLNERWIDVEDPDHPEIVRAADVLSRALGTGDLDLVRSVTTDDFSVVDRRSLGFATLDLDDLAALAAVGGDDTMLVQGEVVHVSDNGVIARSNAWRRADDGRWEEAGVPFLGALAIVGGSVATVVVVADDDLDAARALLDGTARDADEPLNAADEKARRLLQVMAARDMATYRELLADDVVVDDRRAHVQLRAEGVDAVLNMRRPRVFPPDAELVGDGEAIAWRGDELVLRSVAFREAGRSDGPSVKFLAITSWDGDLLTGTTIFDPDAMPAALAELDQLWVEREADVVVRLRTRLSAEVLGAFTRGDTPAGMSFMDDRCTWHDHRPLGFGDLDREGIARRFETLGEIEGERLVYIREAIEFGCSVEFGGPSVMLAGPGGATQRDDQLFVNLMDPSSGMMIDCHHYALDQRAEAEACFSRLMADVRAGGGLWNTAVCVGGMVNTWARRDETERIGSWVAEGATLEGAGDLDGRELGGGVGIGASHRRVLAVRGEQLALSELRDAFGDESFHRIVVEEVDRDARLSGITLFAGDDLTAATRHLEERWIELEGFEDAEAGVRAVSDQTVADASADIDADDGSDEPRDDVMNDGEPSAAEWFPEDQAAEAFARFEELTTPPSSADHEPWNEADRLARELTIRATARELDEVVPMLGDEVVIDDRRPMVGATFHGRDAALRFVAPVTPDLAYSARIETLACRGQAHVLTRTSLYQVDGEATISGLHLTSWADGELLRWTLFDPDDVDAAVAALDRLYLDQLDDPLTGFWLRTLGVACRAFAAGDEARFREDFHEEMAIRDRRRLGWPDLDLDGIVGRARTLWEVGGRLTSLITRVHRIEGRFVLYEQLVFAAPSNGAEFRELSLVVLEASAETRLSVGVDQFADDDLARATEHFETLCAADAAAPANGVEEIGRAFCHSVALGRRQRARLMLADDLLVEDGSGTSLIASVDEVVDPGAAGRLGLDLTDRQLVEARGNRLALHEVRGEIDGERIQRYTLEEVTPSGQLSRIVHFDADERNLAIDRLRRNAD